MQVKVNLPKDMLDALGGESRFSEFLQGEIAHALDLYTRKQSDALMKGDLKATPRGLMSET